MKHTESSPIAFKDWRARRLEGAKSLEEICRSVERFYQIPTNGLGSGSKKVSHLIHIHCVEGPAIEVALEVSGGNKVDLEGLGADELEALARTRRAVEAWVGGERPLLPSAKELHLKDVTASHR